MKDTTKRFLVPIGLLGGVLIIAQILFAFIGNFLRLDRMLSSTASTMLTSTNREIMENMDGRFDRMMRIGNQIASDSVISSYNRLESTLSKQEQAATEVSIGQSLALYSALDDFCDCCIIFKDSSYLGQLDARTQELYSDSIYDSFKDTGERDAQNFFIGENNDYSRIYFAKSINSGSLVLISILCESMNPIFYDAEENYDLTLHISTKDHHVIYSGDKDESINGVLNGDLAQTIESSTHTSMEMRGQIIASDTCSNGFRVTSTIAESSLTLGTGNLKIVYLIISSAIIALSVFLMIILCRAILRRSKQLDSIEENIEDYTNLDDININM